MVNIKLIQIAFMVWVISRILFVYADRLFDRANGKILVSLLFDISFLSYILAKGGFLLLCVYELFLKTGNYQFPICTFLLVCVLSQLIPKRR